MSTLLNFTPADNNLSGILTDSNAAVGKLLQIVGVDDGVLQFSPIGDAGVSIRQIPMFLLEGKLYSGGNAVVGDNVRVLFKGVVSGLPYASEPDVGDYVYRGTGAVLSLTPWGSATIRLGKVIAVDTEREEYTCWFDGTFSWDTLTGG